MTAPKILSKSDDEARLKRLHDPEPSPVTPATGGGASFIEKDTEALDAIAETRKDHGLPPMPPTVEEARKPYLNLVSLAEILKDKKPPEYLVKGRLPLIATSTVFAEAGAGKTWLSCDFACHIGSGLAWLGAAVRKGPVVYLAGEGIATIRTRLAAWVEVHPDSLPDVHVSDRGGILDTFDGLTEVKTLIDELPEKPVLVVIDTKARWMSGDENSSKDAGMFVRNVDELRDSYGCHVLNCHHTGKDSAKGARGSTAFRGADDVEIFLKQTQHEEGAFISATWTKVRSGKVPPPGFWELRSLTLPEWLDEDGEALESAYLVPVEEIPGGGDGRPRKDIPPDEIKRVVLEFPHASKTELTSIMADRFGVSKGTASTRLDELVGLGVLVSHSGGTGRKTTFAIGGGHEPT